MIKMAACGELQELSSRPHTSDSHVRYIWAPKRSQLTKHPPRYSQSAEGRGNEGYYQGYEEAYGGLSEGIEDAPFKLPDNDTIIRTAHQLSRLASRNGTRSASGIEGVNGSNRPSKEKAQDDHVNKLLGQKLKEYANQGSANKRQRSASLSVDNKRAGQSSARPKRARSSSLNSGIKDRLPPIRAPGPVNVSITKEKIQGGSGSARLRYTSHWDA